MKVSEFEEKLTTVSDQRLRRMLAESRDKGPEIAVNLILAEGRRRGVDLEEGTPSRAEPDGPLGAEAAPAFSEEAGSSGKGAWLNEEANRGLPTSIKVLITVVVLGGVLAFLFVLFNKG